jgi:transcriptional regulator with XRE-family HTH domain
MQHFTQPPAADTLGGRIVQARSFALLKQRHIEDALGVSRRTLSSWEHDRTSPTVHQLIMLANLTGFPAGWFVEGLGVSELEGSLTPRYDSAVTVHEVPGQLTVFDLEQAWGDDPPPQEPVRGNGHARLSSSRGRQQ